MSILNLTTGMAGADYPLSANVPVVLEENLETAYEQTVWDHAAIGGSEWKKSIQDADTWEGLVPTSTPCEGGFMCAYPLRPVREGGWRHVILDIDYQVDHTTTLRVYLIPAARWYTFDPSAADPLPGVASYAEAELTAATWTTVSLEVTPEECDVLTGDGTVPGIAIPIVYVQLLVKSATDATYIEFQSCRIRESLS